MTGWSGSTRRSRLPKTQAWERIRAQVKARAGGQCQAIEAGQRCTQPGSECDHITPTDDHSLSNLQWLCHACHARKTQGEARRARRGRRPPDPHPGALP